MWHIFGGDAITEKTMFPIPRTFQFLTGIRNSSSVSRLFCCLQEGFGRVRSRRSPGLSDAVVFAASPYLRVPVFV